MKTRLENNKKQIDITGIFLSLREKHTEVFIFQLGDEVFLYKQLGRKDFKDLIEADISDFDKEEILCEECVLYPENYDFENCDAGLPSLLSKEILKNSFLDSLESRQHLINVFREEMHDIDNQVSCLIHEAFPEYEIEEIEMWDMQRTAKMLSRAEWILVNLRGAAFVKDPFTGMSEEDYENYAQGKEEQEVVTEEVDAEDIEFRIETVEERQERLKNVKVKKQKMTPEKLREMQAKYPEMNWGSNVFEEVTIDSLKDSVSVESPALRPGW